VLGVPSCSFFRGRLGRVDDQLEQEGRLLMLRGPDEARRLPLIPRTAPATAPDNTALAAFISDAIEGASQA
jgi:hypothetical protein